MSNPEEAVIEQAIETLHSLMNVLTKLDESLRALSQEVYEAELVHDAKLASDADQEGIDDNKPGEPTTSVDSSERKSVRRSTVRKSQMKQPIESHSDASVDAGAPSTERKSVKRSTIRKSQMQQPTAPVDADAPATERKSVKRSTIRKSQIQPPESNLDENRASSIQNQDHDDVNTEPTSNDITRKSVRSSVRSTVRKSTTTESGVSDERASKRDITGRLTMFLGQFDSYVSEISGKIETLNERVGALGNKTSDDENPKSS